VGKGVKNYFRILASRKKHLRAFAQQVFQTTVLNTCLNPPREIGEAAITRGKSAMKKMKSL